MERMMKIIIADDHPIVRQGLRSLIDAEPGWHLVGESDNGFQTIELVDETQPDVAIIDLMMPDLGGLEVIRRVLKSKPDTGVIALSMHADEAYVVEALRSGARGYVVKATSTEHLTSAVREVQSGGYYLSPPHTHADIHDYLKRAEYAGQSVDKYELLTEREREVLHLIVQGETSNQIAERFSISPRTVESHRANLMKKLQVRSSSDLYHFAYRRGLVSSENETLS
jgi:two-component system, NarL family, response regulator NreC